MKKTTFERLAVRGKEMLKLLPATAVSLGALLGSTPTATAAEIYGEDQSVNVTEVTKLPATSIVDGEATQVMDLYPEMKEGQDVQAQVTENTGEQIAYVLETKETKNHPTFNIEPGVCYSTEGGDVSFISRISGSGEVLPGVSVYGHVDFKNKLEDPTKMEGVSGKFTSSVKLGGGATLNYDHTLTGGGDNIFRGGAGYGGKIGGVNYNVIVNPLNSNGSSLSGKASASGKVGKNGNISSFIFVDSGKHFGNVTYYSETQYTQNITKNLGVYGGARVSGNSKGITNTDIVGGVRFQY